MAQAQRKVVVRRRDGGLVWGYLPAAGFVENGNVDLMGVDGRIIALHLSWIQTIAYVRDFNLTDSTDPERMGRRTFLGRPRTGGLWVRLTFAEDDVLEGVTDFDRTALDGLADDGGLMLNPPDGRGNTLKLFVPRMALQRVEVLGWIAAGAKTKPEMKAKRLASEGQTDLFR